MFRSLTSTLAASRAVAAAAPAVVNTNAVAAAAAATSASAVARAASTFAEYATTATTAQPFPASEEADPAIAEIGKANQEWIARMKAADPTFFDKLGAGQSPKFLWIGCSDSRVPANEIMGLPPGSVFVHRNIANLVVNNDMNLLSVLQYAVEVLQVPHIIVCGHYECGGIKASLSKNDHGLLENWLRNIRDVHRIHHEELSLITDEAAKERRLVELSVVEQCLNLYKNGAIQKKRLATFHDKANFPFAQPRIHGFVFDPRDGVLQNLKVNFKDVITEHSDVYDLYDSPEKNDLVL